jgi:hypothetical protein
MLGVKVGGGRYGARLPAMANWASDIRTNRKFPLLEVKKLVPHGQCLWQNPPYPKPRKPAKSYATPSPCHRQLDRSSGPFVGVLKRNGADVAVVNLPSLTFQNALHNIQLERRTWRGTSCGMAVKPLDDPMCCWAIGVEGFSWQGD